MKRGEKFILISLLILLVILPIISSAQLKVTQEHPFLVNNKWIPAKDLQVGNILKTFDGRLVKITNIKDVFLDEPVPVFNLHTSWPNTFFANDVLVHNKEKIISGDRISCVGDCISGKTKINIRLPNKKTHQMTMAQLYGKMQENPCRNFEIMDIKGEFFKIKIERSVYSGKMHKISIENGQTMTLTDSHMVYVKTLETVSGKTTPTLKVIPTSEVKFRDAIMTNQGPKRITKLDSFDAKCQNVYKPIPKEGVERLYSFSSDGGMYIMNPPPEGIALKWSRWTPERIYARIMSSKEAKRFDITRKLPQLDRKPGDLVPTFDANSKADLTRLSTMSHQELKDFYRNAGGTGQNDVIRFFTSEIPPNADSISMRGVTGYTEAKFDIEIRVERVKPPF